jgi:biotin carboxylase
VTLRVLLVMRTRTYRAKAFLRASDDSGCARSVATLTSTPSRSAARGAALALDFANPRRAQAQIAEFAASYPLGAVVGVDDDTVVLAAQLAETLGLPRNSVDSVKAARYKDVMRLALLEVDGVPSPAFWLLSTQDDPASFAASAPYPVVLKPLSLAASRGVIRANTPTEFVAAFREICAILAESDLREDDPGAHQLMVEQFIPGVEVSLEGLLIDGRLMPLALFDKPDPLDGPYFEETIYVTPSRLPIASQDLIVQTAQKAAGALGLAIGPVHAELRLNEQGAWIVEVAARSIGGLCSSTLRFGEGVSLEEIILRQAAGLELSSLEREQRPAGVMMIPIPAAGVLRRIDGIDAGRRVAGITDITISTPCGERVEKLPRASRYLGFIYASADTPEGVEHALRAAHRQLRIEITP